MTNGNAAKLDKSEFGSQFTDLPRSRSVSNSRLDDGTSCWRDCRETEPCTLGKFLSAHSDRGISPGDTDLGRSSKQSSAPSLQKYLMAGNELDITWWGPVSFMLVEPVVENVSHRGSSQRLAVRVRLFFLDGGSAKQKEMSSE